MTGCSRQASPGATLLILLMLLESFRNVFIKLRNNDVDGDTVHTYVSDIKKALPRDVDGVLFNLGETSGMLVSEV